jgi:hypothetical protein
MTWEVPSHTSTFHRPKAAPAGSFGRAMDDVRGQEPSTPFALTSRGEDPRRLQGPGDRGCEDYKA